MWGKRVLVDQSRAMLVRVRISRLSVDEKCGGSRCFRQMNRMTARGEGGRML